MSIGAILLRLLLCIALALNGVSVAHAGLHVAHGQSMAAMPAAIDPAPQSDDASPCHGGRATDEQASQGAASHPMASQDASTPECCDDGCQGACMQHATPAMAMAVFTALMAQDRVRQGGGITHVPPASVRLNRPPIV